MTRKETEAALTQEEVERWLRRFDYEKTAGEGYRAHTYRLAVWGGYDRARWDGDPRHFPPNIWTEVHPGPLTWTEAIEEAERFRDTRAA